MRCQNIVNMNFTEKNLSKIKKIGKKNGVLDFFVRTYTKIQ